MQDRVTAPKREPVELKWVIESDLQLAEEDHAVEFICIGLTSQNFDNKLKWGSHIESMKYQKGITKAFPHIKYCELDNPRYNIMDFTRDRIPVEY